MTTKTSDIKVLRSNAGYYIGREYFDEELERWLPYTRESVEYYSSKDKAEEALKNSSYKRRNYL